MPLSREKLKKQLDKLRRINYSYCDLDHMGWHLFTNGGRLRMIGVDRGTEIPSQIRRLMEQNEAFPQGLEKV